MIDEFCVLPRLQSFCFSSLCAQLLQSRGKLSHRFDGSCLSAPLASTDVQEMSFLDLFTIGCDSNAATKAISTPDCNYMHYQTFLVSVHLSVGVPGSGLTDRVISKFDFCNFTSRIGRLRRRLGGMITQLRFHCLCFVCGQPSLLRLEIPNRVLDDLVRDHARSSRIW